MKDTQDIFSKVKDSTKFLIVEQSTINHFNKNLEELPQTLKSLYIDILYIADIENIKNSYIQTLPSSLTNLIINKVMIKNDDNEWEEYIDNHIFTSKHQNEFIRTCFYLPAECRVRHKKIRNMYLNFYDVFYKKDIQVLKKKDTIYHRHYHDWLITKDFQFKWTNYLFNDYYFEIVL